LVLPKEYPLIHIIEFSGGLNEFHIGKKGKAKTHLLLHISLFAAFMEKDLRGKMRQT
jgi:hypothetical protein